MSDEDVREADYDGLKPEDLARLQDDPEARSEVLHIISGAAAMIETIEQRYEELETPIPDSLVDILADERADITLVAQQLGTTWAELLEEDE